LFMACSAREALMLVAMLDMFAPPRMQVLETKKLIGLPAQGVGRPKKTRPLNQADESAP